MKNEKTVITNLIISSGTQLIILALGLVLPRIILTSWGSEYNGLINSVTTIMRYLSLLEAGINTSTLQALYKSIGENDRHQTSVIIRSAKQYYHNVSVIYTALVLLISFVYPLFLKTTINYWEIFFVFVLQGLTGVISFAFRAAYQQLLNAEGKYYVISLVTLFTNICTFAAKIVSIRLFNGIILMQLLGVLIMLMQTAIYAVYFKRKYQWIDTSVESNMGLLENRRYYQVQQLAGLVFNSTDTFVLSIFCGLKVASVYTVYNMVYSALSTVIGIIRGSTNFVLGQSYHKSKAVFFELYHAYSGLQICIGCALTSISMLLITGFVTLYTAGVEDINYLNYTAAILFSLNIILDCTRGASLAGANIAGLAPKTAWRYLMEAGINLSVSLLLVRSMGINGVLIGTVVAGLWRSTDSLVFFHRKVLQDRPLKEILFILINLIVFCGFAFLGSKNLFVISTYAGFVKLGVLFSVIVVLFLGLLYLLFYKRNLLSLREVAKEKEE